MTIRLLTTAVLALAASTALAKQAPIVFDLETGSPAVAPVPKASPVSPAGAASAKAAPSPRAKALPGGRSKVSTRSSEPSDKMVARIGVVTWYNAPIYDSPQSKQLYNVLQPGQNLILIGYNNDYYGVKMVDGRLGWIKKSYVQLLDVEMLVDPPSLNGAPRTLPGSAVPLLQTAYGYLGIPYRWGGTSSRGIDCSGFVQSVFRKHGVSLPRVARDQARVGTPVPKVPASLEYLQPGDRLYFACNHSYVDHTGIYIGAGYFIHSSGGRGVGVDYLPGSSTYRNGLVGARRF